MKAYPKHYCGIFGIIQPGAAEYAYYGMLALQHRGQESTGIIGTDGAGFFEHKDMGLVFEVFTESAMRKFGGDKTGMAVGHNRYSTTGQSELRNAQPISMECRHGLIALAHNGNLTNAESLRVELEAGGAAFQTTTDSEVMLMLLARYDGSLEEAVLSMMDKVDGAYSLVIMTPKALIAVRDPHGFRPLSIGRLNGKPVMASETCAFDSIGASFERDVSPGEVVIFENGGVRTCKARKQAEKTFCVFEGIYFMRPDSILEGRSVYEARYALGVRLAEEHPIEADMVVPIPDSGNCAARGYADALGIRLVDAFVRSHYIGRSFINPTQSGREKIVDLKLNLIPRLVHDKRVVVIDDSIVRGTTCRTRVRKFREAGARKVHVLASCPPHRYPCHYGIDFPDRAKLIAANHSLEEIRKILSLDSLGYLSEEGLASVLGCKNCMACFNGHYPAAPG